jgi:autotransporter-associated beta strand protein
MHAIDVEYYQGYGGASMDLQWDPTGGNNFADIPYSAFSTSANDVFKTGSGTLTLANTDTYLGPTTVDAGKLVVNGHLLNSTVAVNAGGMLAGNGQVPAATVQSGGVIAPGNSPVTGGITAGGLSLAPGSIFRVDLAGTTAGNQYDQIFIPAGGTVALGNSTLNVSFQNGFVPAVGQQFVIIKNRGGSSIAGTFSQGSVLTSNGYVFGINYAGGAGHDVVLTVLGQNVNGQVGVGTSALVDNTATTLSGGTMTITNTGTTNLVGTLGLELTGLPPGVTLANASGTTSNGNPYLSVNLPNGGLTPGQSVNVTVLFENPNRVAVSYSIFAFGKNANS